MNFYTSKKKIFVLGLIAIISITMLLLDGCTNDIDDEVLHVVQYNVPYVCLDGDGNGRAYVFYEDGMFCRFFINSDTGLVNTFFTHEVMIGYRRNGLKAIELITNDEFKFNDDGSSFVFDGKTYVATGTVHGIYLESVYTNSADDTLLFTNEGTAIYNNENDEGFHWSDLGHRGWSMQYDYFISMDGEVVFLVDNDTDNTFVFKHG